MKYWMWINTPKEATVVEVGPGRTVGDAVRFFLELQNGCAPLKSNTDYRVWVLKPGKKRAVQYMLRKIESYQCVPHYHCPPPEGISLPPIDDQGVR